MGNVADLIAKYGFPIVAAAGMGYMIYYVWTWATTIVKPVLKDANTVLIALIDRIRMLDNDLIRLNQKVNIVLMLREMQHDELLTKASEFRKSEKRAKKVPQQKPSDEKKEEPKSGK
jgi:hypothetical protein